MDNQVVFDIDSGVTTEDDMIDGVKSVSGDFNKVATKADIPTGQVKVYKVAGKRIALCNVEGKFFAVDDLCTHDGGPLGEGELVENTIECPRHGARFDVETGAVVCMPAVVPIATYPCEERGDDLWVNVSRKRS